MSSKGRGGRGLHQEGATVDGLRAMHAVSLHWTAVPGLPASAPSPWGLSQHGWSVRWVISLPVSGFVIADARGQQVLLHTALGRPGEAPDREPYYAALMFNLSFSNFVDTDGDLPNHWSGEGARSVRLHGWAQVRRLHQIALSLPDGAGGAAVRQALSWSEMEERAAQRWQAAGAHEVEAALRFDQVGLRPAQAAPWTASDYDEEDVAVLVAAGWTFEEGRRLLGPSRDEPAFTEGVDWHPFVRAGIGPEVVILCLGAGVSLAEYRSQRPEIEVLRILAAMRARDSA